jgi:hypothetical protein
MEVEKERRVFTPHSCHFSLCIFELCNLDVLRVLSKQTLEINKEVKYSSVLDSSLAKVVKYPTLTILFSSNNFSGVLWRRGRFGAFL